MQKHTRLFIDKAGSDFDPNQDLVLGPWCLGDLFSLNEIKEFYTKGVFLEDKSTDCTKAFKCCEEQHARLIDEVANYVKSINKNKYSQDFFKDFPFKEKLSEFHVNSLFYLIDGKDLSNFQLNSFS